MPAPSHARQSLPRASAPPSRPATGVPGGPVPEGRAVRVASAPLRSSGRAPHAPARRLVIVVALVVVTLVGGAWYLLSRSGADAPTHDYLSAEQRFGAAAYAVHFTPLVVQQFRQLSDFNDALDAQALVMEQVLADFDRMAKTEEGSAAAIAAQSVKTTTRALRAVSDFRDAIVSTNDLADAQDALARIDAAARELHAKAKEWKGL